MTKPFMGSIAGTILMTLYSYWAARRHNEQFEEPQMLGKLIKRHPQVNLPAAKARSLGWLVHYSIGLGFNLLYHQWWKGKNKGPTAGEGLLVGAPSGIAGIAAWHSSLKLHPAPPQTHLKKYHKQLFVAHLVFGVASALAYRLQKD